MFEYQTHNTYFAQIADGLETIGIAELVELGATNARSVRRGIHFGADRAALYRINYGARLITRVLAPLRSFACADADAIYRAGRAIDWPLFFGPDRTFAVFAATAGSSVPHSQYAGLKLKDAVADRFRDACGRRPDVDPRQPDVWINLHAMGNRATISFDTSGGSLHRRGYRRQGGTAPMQETVAAAMLRLAGWNGQTALVDPMCGSGTLVIEAAMAHCRIPAGFLRKVFGFERLPDFDADLWASVKAAADRGIRKLPEGLICASDVDHQAVKATRTNCRQLPDLAGMNVLRLDFRQIEHLRDHLIVCNPPYGIRMQAEAPLRDFYRQLGDFLKQRCQGSQAYIYFGRRELIKWFGLKPSWKKPLRNGGLDGRLVKYELY